MAEDEMEGLPKWKQRKVNVACESGPVEVLAVVHPWCPGLAATMCSFGAFVVTHRASGRKIGGTYGISTSALAELVGWQQVALALGFSWEADGAECAAAVRDGATAPMPGHDDLTVGLWVGIVRGEDFDDVEDVEGEADARMMAGLRALSPEPEPAIPGAREGGER